MLKPPYQNHPLAQKALAFAREIHGEKKRLSGEPYIVHSAETANILIDLQMDQDTIVAAILHDLLGEEGVSEKQIEKEFGENVLLLLKRFEKLESMKYQGTKRYAENLRKMLIVSAKDVRVLILRFAHRLHNLRTLLFVPEEKRGRIAAEALEIYAPLANRLGMRKLKADIEDAAFPHVHPKDHAEVVRLSERRAKEKSLPVEEFSRELETRLREQGIAPIRIDCRVKHLYSLYRKLLEKNMDVEQIYDVAAVRVIVGTVEECYRVLGVIHNCWTPVAGRLRDYIATPKPNGYQSIHTVIFTPDGTSVEIQIRTKEMDDEAEYGIAAHLAYAESGKPATGGVLSKKLLWVKQLLEWQKRVHESKEFLESLKLDFFRDRVFTFTPRGDVIELPEEASPIDFAYAIHSDLGDHAAGAKVNGRITALDHTLANGDQVEILSSRNARPSPKWLTFTKTALARKHIRVALAEKKSK